MRIEVSGLELWGHHGVEEEERERGQRFVFDVEVEPVDERAAATDRIEDAVDYRRVVEIVREVSDARRHRLLEALAVAVADALLGQLAVSRARVRVRKPDVRLRAPVEHSGVTVVRERA